MKKILIIGATSAIAEKMARLWAEEGCELYLIARNAERLKNIMYDLTIRGAKAVHHAVIDLNDISAHKVLIQKVMQIMGKIDIVLIAHGVLGHQTACETDFNLALASLQTNMLSTMSLLTELAHHFVLQKQGVIAVITSVAGDRGRASNYIYGAGKAAVDVFLQGLRQRLHDSRVHVLTIKPGPVDTPMTKNFAKGFLWTHPERVARDIRKAIHKKKHVLYTPWFWKGIMTCIKGIPERIFKRIKR